MDRLKYKIFVLIFLNLASSLFADSPVTDPFVIDWMKMEISLSGSAQISPKDKGNFIEWQFEATMKAKQDLVKNFITSLNTLRIDAYNYAHDLLIKNPEENEKVYNYLQSQKRYTVKYGERSVTLTLKSPLFGPEGLANLFVTAGKDPGNFPEPQVTTYSTHFSGLVIDVRGLNRTPAIAPRIFDEDHDLLYSVDFISDEGFKKWGAVQYTNDPYYSGFEERVGVNPYKVVAVENIKLIPTDIAIAKEDADILLQNEGTKVSLEEGRVIIITDTDLLEK